MEQAKKRSRPPWEAASCNCDQGKIKHAAGSGRSQAAYKLRPAPFLVAIPINNRSISIQSNGDCCIRAALRAGRLGGPTVGMAGAGVGLAEPAEAGPGAAVRGPPWHGVPLPGRRRQGGGAPPGGGTNQADAFAVARNQRSGGTARPQCHPRTWYSTLLK